VKVNSQIGCPTTPRDVPAESSIPGGCGIITEGYIGYGTFIWPTTETWLSGYDYSPETNHRAIDIAGRIGNPVWAVDAGVIVYAGWNDRGYGNLIVVDHGNGWQSVYAHLDTFWLIAVRAWTRENKSARWVPQATLPALTCTLNCVTRDTRSTPGTFCRINTE